MPEPTAIVFVFHDNDISLMRQSGHPCRPQLCTYKEIDLLSTFFKSVTTIPATTSHYKYEDQGLFGKPVIIQTADNTFLVDQPSICERH